MALISRFILAVGLTLSASAANASTIVDAFTFSDSSNTTLASGTFSYDSSKSGVLSYSDLNSFSISVLGQSYDLAYANSLSPNPDYVYFGYDTGSNLFVPASVAGYQGPYSGIIAATTTATGFFIDPLIGQADPAGTGADGGIAAYSPYVVSTATSYSISAVPEPATWLMLLLGFGGIGFMLRSRRRIHASSAMMA